MSSSDSDTEFFDAREEINSPKPCDNAVFEQLDQTSDAKDESEHNEPSNTLNGGQEGEEQEQTVSGTPEPLPVNGAVGISGADQLASVEDVASAEDVPDSAIPAQAVSEAVETDIVKSACAASISDTDSKLDQQLDLLACVQERPTNLPGVTPVLVAEAEIGDTEERPETTYDDGDKNTVVQEEVLLNHADESVQETDSAVFKRPQPPEPIKKDRTWSKKKVPPPRPAPPRPPPPKRNLKAPPARPGKPFLSVDDDGLLTPNSTVENLTREFTEALNHETSAGNESNKTSPLAKKDANQNRSSNHEEAGEPATDAADTLSSKSNSLGRQDAEILSSVIVRNLDTGESMPLSAAAEQVSQCLNPLALQIMSRTKEFSYAGSSSSTNSQETQIHPQSAISQANYADSDSFSVASDDIDIGKDAPNDKRRNGGSKVKKAKKLKKMMGKGVNKVKVVAGTKVEKAVQKVKHVKEEVMHTETLNVSSDEDSTDFSSSAVKVKASSSNKGPYHFSHVKQVQDIAVHVGAVWSMKFSHCGRLLATAGQDNVIWVWVLKDFYNYFNDMRNKYDSQDEFLDSSLRHTNGNFYSSSDNVFDYEGSARRDSEDEEDDAPFRQVPFSSYVGHSADVLDLAWSKNFFILSSSMDKTVRLWHISRKECLCCFQHIDFVTAIAFHPRDDRYFLSGSLDSKLRLWNIPDKKVALWNEVSPDGSSSSSAGGAGGALITTVNFCENGKFAVCGTYDGRCVFFDTEHLKYHTQIHVRSSRGRNTKGHKITGIEPLNGEHKILVTSNDSRVRLYDLRDLSLVCKYKGHTNLSSQIKASFSPGSKHIICGSEDKSIYIWRTSLPQDVTKLSSFRRDRNDCWESLKAHDAVVTCAVFAPQPRLLYQSNCTASKVESRPKATSILSISSRKQSVNEANVIISADFNGAIKVIVSAE